MAHEQFETRIVMEVRVQWVSDLTPSELQHVFGLLDDNEAFPSPIEWVHQSLQRGALPIVIEDSEANPARRLEIRVDGPDEWLPSDQTNDAEPK